MDYDNLRQLADAATPGPWKLGEPQWRRGPWPGTPSYKQPVTHPHGTVCNTYRGVWVDVNKGLVCTDDPDGAFIAAAREAVPALLDDRDRLAAEVVALREAIHQLVEAMRRIERQALSYVGRVDVSIVREAGQMIATYAVIDPSPAVAEIERLVKIGQASEYDQTAKVPKEA